MTDSRRVKSKSWAKARVEGNLEASTDKGALRSETQSCCFMFSNMLEAHIAQEGKKHVKREFSKWFFKIIRVSYSKVSLSMMNSFWTNRATNFIHPSSDKTRGDKSQIRFWDDIYINYHVSQCDLRNTRLVTRSVTNMLLLSEIADKWKKNKINIIELEVREHEEEMKPVLLKPKPVFRTSEWLNSI